MLKKKALSIFRYKTAAFRYKNATTTAGTTTRDHNGMFVLVATIVHRNSDFCVADAQEHYKKTAKFRRKSEYRFVNLGHM